MTSSFLAANKFSPYYVFMAISIYIFLISHFFAAFCQIAINKNDEEKDIESLSTSSSASKKYDQKITIVKSKDKVCKDRLWVKYNNLDYYDHDEMIIQHKPIENCQKLCGDMPKCIGFNYIRKHLFCGLKISTVNWITHLRYSDSVDFYHKLPCHSSFKSDCQHAKDKKGHDYVGHIDFIHTFTNITKCQDWSRQNKYSLEDLNARSWDQIKNYCRNPIKSHLPRPWCYTKIMAEDQTFCDIMTCEQRNCILLGDETGAKYTGIENKAASGETCLAWTDQKKYTREDFNVDSLKYIKNYCRNPRNDHKMPGCYIIKSNNKVTWSACKQIKKCQNVLKVDKSVYIGYASIEYANHNLTEFTNSSSASDDPKNCAKKCTAQKNCIGFDISNTEKLCRLKSKEIHHRRYIDYKGKFMKQYYGYDFYLRVLDTL